MHWHHTLDPLATRKVEHVVATRVAACSGLNVVLANHTLDVKKRVSASNYIQLIHIRFHILHASFEVVNGVLVLQLEVTLIVVNARDNVVTKLAQREQDILVASMEKIETANCVHL